MVFIAALFRALQQYDPSNDLALYKMAFKQFLPANNIKAIVTGSTG